MCFYFYSFFAAMKRRKIFSKVIRLSNFNKRKIHFTVEETVINDIRDLN